MLSRVAVPWSTLSPPPRPSPVLGSVLSAMVQLTAVSVPAISSMPAPTFSAELPATVLLVTVSVPPFSYSPPPGPVEPRDGIARQGTVHDCQCTGACKDAAAALGGRIARKRAAGDRNRTTSVVETAAAGGAGGPPVAALSEKVLSVIVSMLGRSSPSPSS